MPRALFEFGPLFAQITAAPERSTRPVSGTIALQRVLLLHAPPSCAPPHAPRQQVAGPRSIVYPARGNLDTVVDVMRSRHRSDAVAHERRGPSALLSTMLFRDSPLTAQALDYALGMRGPSLHHASHHASLTDPSPAASAALAALRRGDAPGSCIDLTHRQSARASQNP
jgi:hypothetical protein